MPSSPDTVPLRALLLLLIASTVPAPSFGDDAVREVESVTLDVDTRVRKRMAAMGEFVAEEQWSRGIDLVREIDRTHAGSLVELEPGRYVEATRFTSLILASLPPSGLAAYRQTIDPEVRPAFERAIVQHDEASLARIVREAYVSSVTDEALLTLGDLAFERGDLGAARGWWTQLVPLPEAARTPGEPVPRLRYPDPDVPRPAVLARLIAATLLGDEPERADAEIGFLAERFPDAAGSLFGREGRYVELVEELRDQADGWPASGGGRTGTTFGGSPSRSPVAVRPPDVFGGVTWSTVPPITSLPIPVSRPLLVDDGPLTTHPVVWRDVLLAAGEDRIVAWNLATGEPWPDAEDTPVLHRAGAAVSFPRKPIVGVPRFTLTVDDDGLLYARLGSPITGRGSNEIGEVGSELVCLDLAGAEGNLLARITPREVTGESGWSFEGSPVVERGRAYVLLRRVDPQTEIAAARIEIRPVGDRDHEFRVVWKKRVCGALEHVDGNRNIVSHLLPTLADGQLFVSTDLGAIVSMDAETGRLEWAVTYGSERAESIETASDHTRQGVLPPLVHDDRVYVAPNDSNDVFALDRVTGQVLWRRSLPDRIRHLLGAGEGRLIASGDSLWGLDVHTGHVAWAKRRFEPEHFGYGRGVIADRHVWWPHRDGIDIVRVVDGQPSTGERVPHHIDLAQRGIGGGNLLVANGRLIVTEPQRIAVLRGR